MSPAFLGFMLGLGIICMLSAFVGTPDLPSWNPRWWREWGDLITRSGIRWLTRPRQMIGSMILALISSLIVLVYTRTWTVALIIGIIILPLPSMLIAGKARKNAKKTRAAWPETVDTLVAGIRAGASLPEIVCELGRTGCADLRPYFQQFDAVYRSDGHFDVALSHLKDRMADPIADRIVEALRLARDVGSSDLVRLLQNLARLLREDARMRGELEARQSWTVNAARLAVAAPWIVLILIASQPHAGSAYSTVSGLMVLSVGAILSILAYLLMLRLGRLSIDQRSLR